MARLRHSESMIQPPTSAAPGVADVRRAAERIAPFARRTPVLTAVVDGRPVTLKLEHLQLTGSFKLRGALNALLVGSPPQRAAPAGSAVPAVPGGSVPPASEVPVGRPDPAPVVSASGGNHGLGVATAARLIGVPAVIYVPRTVPPDKERRIAATGAEVVRHGRWYAEAEAAARAHADRAGLRFLPAYDDVDVVAGQGTVGLEVAEQAPDCDAVAAAVGGGGLLAGVGRAIGARTVVAVEPDGCASLHAAFAAGEPVDAPVDSIAASALGATRVGRIPFAMLRAAAPVLALVTEDEIRAARDRLWDEFRLAVEPAGAVAFAAWLAGRVPGDHACVIICGANTDWTPA